MPDSVQAIENLDMLIVEESRGEKNEKEVQAVVEKLARRSLHRESFMERLFREFLPSLVKAH